MELNTIAQDISDALYQIDESRKPFKQFQPGVGPYGEPQLVRLIKNFLNNIEIYGNTVQTKRTPDILIPTKWAIEVKIVRPFGDNGLKAENWSVNLIHPYEGNVSSLGDAIKLKKFDGCEKKSVLVIGYEHNPPIIDIDPLLLCFELIADKVLDLKLSQRVEIIRSGLIHPVHQRFRVVCWEIY